MRRIIPILLALLLPVLLTGCIDYDYFGLSKVANVTYFDIEGQLSNKIEPMVDWEDMGEITIYVPNTYDLTNLTVTRALCTELAHYDIDPYELKDFSEPVYFTVTAEDTTIKKQWMVTVKQDVPDRQVAFSAMNRWTDAYDPDGNLILYTENNLTKTAYFPGNGTDLSPWSTPAKSNGYSLAQINTMTVNPMPGLSTASYARIETIFVQSGTTEMAEAMVVTGALFTGEFHFDITYAPGLPSSTNEPRKMVKLGTNFYYKPTSARFKMRYHPGATMMDGSGTPITTYNADGRPLLDSCDIYAILHNRQTEGTYIRVGAAHFRTSQQIGDMNDDTNGFVEVTMDFVYGKPSAQVLAEKPYLQIGGSRGELTFYEFPVSRESEPVTEVYSNTPETTDVNYISILFSSSAYGDNFWGAVNPDGEDGYRGSTLDIKDFELLYD